MRRQNNNTLKQLNRRHNERLVPRDLREKVKLPEGEDINEWWAVNIMDFFNCVNQLYGTVSSSCTNQSCPVMSAGPKYDYLWADGKTIKKPIKVSAPEYMDYLMIWVQELFDDDTIFPDNYNKPFPKNFQSVIKVITRRLFRVYAHLYYHHQAEIQNMNIEPLINRAFKEFYLFIREFDLLDPKELHPLEYLTDDIDAMYPKPNAENEIRNESTGIRRTRRIGFQTQETKRFDDSTFLFESIHKDITVLNSLKWRLHSVVAIGDTTCAGIQLIYEINGLLMEAPTHGNFLSTREEYKLDWNECIIGLKGYCNEHVKSLQLVTNKRTITIGENREPNFSIELPSGSKVVAIAGGLGNYLHSVGFSFVRLGWSPANCIYMSIEDKNFVKTVLLVHTRCKNLLLSNYEDNCGIILFGRLPKDMLNVIIGLCIPTSARKIVPQMSHDVYAYRW